MTGADGQRRPSGSVAIPAHDEAAVIVRCLDHLFSGLGDEQIEVVVACNGCTDDTADLARASGHPVTVLETDTPSKPVALRMADEALVSYPRIYLDADIVLEGVAALAVLRALREGPAPAARPPIRYDSARSSWPVRAYYRARTRVPSVMTSLWGAGMYGLSEAGRARFGPYPDVVGEDLYVDSLFSRTEIAIVDTSPVVVNVPRRLRPLLEILRRTYRGNAEHGRVHEGADLAHRAEAPASVAREVLRSGRDGIGAAADAIMYLAVAVAARGLARIAPAARWERDTSSREG